MFYAGLDLGGKRSRLHVCDQEGAKIFSGWVHDPQELVQTVAPWKSEISIALEATSGAFHVHDVLREHGIPAKVAHPRDLRAIAHARIKNDRLDAEKLSHLHRGDLIPEVWVPPAKLRDQRELLLEDSRLGRAIRSEKVKVRALLRRWGLSTRVEKPFTKAGVEELRQLPLPQGAACVLKGKMTRLEDLAKQRREMTKVIEEQIPLGDAEHWLKTIPGFGPLTARALANVIGDASRFPDARRLASYIGLVGGERSSGESIKRGSITKEGNAWLRWLMVQAAWRAVRSKKDPAQPWATLFARLVARGKSKGRAIIAVANHLARVVFAVLRDRRAYRAQAAAHQSNLPEAKIYKLKSCPSSA